MAGAHDELWERLTFLIVEDEVLTPSQLKHEALAVKECQATATWDSVIGMIQQLLTLLAGGVVHATGRHTERYKAWICGSDQDRMQFIYIVQAIAADLHIGYSLAARVPIDEATRTTQTLCFTFLAYIKRLGFHARYQFGKAETELSHPGTPNGHKFYHDLDLFLWTIEVCALKTMEKIVSVISLEEMQESLHSKNDKLSLTMSAGCFYSYKLQDTGEVSKFLITADGNFAQAWINLWRKVDRTSNLDYLFFKAPNLSCICRRSIEPGLACVILDNCYDLLCVECANVMDSTNGFRRCPFCFAVAKNWMTSAVFEELKTRMKKRKEDTAEWRLSIWETDKRKIPVVVRRITEGLVRAVTMRCKGDEG